MSGSTTSLKQKRVKERLRKAREHVALRRALFLAKAASRHGLRLELPQVTGIRPCHLRNPQLVKEVTTVAGVQLFKSSACGGCNTGYMHLQTLRNSGSGPFAMPPDVLGCPLVRHTWMIAPGKVSVGDITESVELASPEK